MFLGKEQHCRSPRRGRVCPVEEWEDWVSVCLHARVHVCAPVCDINGLTENWGWVRDGMQSSGRGKVGGAICSHFHFKSLSG